MMTGEQLKAARYSISRAVGEKISQSHMADSAACSTRAATARTRFANGKTVTGQPARSARWSG
jgi:hypothetical protein